MIDRLANAAVVGVPARPTAPTDAAGPGAPVSAAQQGPTVPLPPPSTIASDAALSSRGYDLAALAAAMTTSAGVTTESAEPGHAVNSVVEAAARLLPPAAAAAIARLLRAIALEGPTGEIARGIEERLSAGGLLFEAHARAALTEERPGSEQPMTAVLSDDLRVLLARLVRGAQNRPGSPRLASGDETRTIETSGLSETESVAVGLVAERVLAEQLHMAHEWVADAAVAFELPLRLGQQEARALVRFRKEAGESASAGPAACVVSVQVASETLGPVSAAARWQGGTCHAAFFVERPESVPALQGHVEGLREGLGAVFSRLTIDISVDPARARRSPSSPPAPPQPGSVVSVRT